MSYGQHLIVTQAAGRVYSLDAKSGQMEWDRRLEDTVHEAAQGTAGQVAVNGDLLVYGIDTADGEIEWTTASGGRTEGAPSVVGSQVFWGTRDGTVASADARDGSPLWISGTNTEVVSPPLASDGHGVWVRASHTGQFLIFSPTTCPPDKSWPDTGSESRSTSIWWEASVPYCMKGSCIW